MIRPRESAGGKFLRRGGFGVHCNAITDHVWVTPEHISIMCDRRSRVAFIRGLDGWRFTRPWE
jgi:hypothetical protein